MDRSALGPVRLGTTLRAPIATTRHAALRTIDPREKRRAQDAHGQQYDAHHETHRRDVEFESPGDRGKAGHEPAERQRSHLRGHLDSQKNQGEGKERSEAPHQRETLVTRRYIEAQQASNKRSLHQDSAGSLGDARTVPSETMKNSPFQPLNHAIRTKFFSSSRPAPERMSRSCSLTPFCPTEPR